MWVRRIGVFIIGVSVYLFASNYNITGAVVGHGLEIPVNLFAIILLAMGVFLVLTDKQGSTAVLENIIDVYDDNGGKNEKGREKRHYFMTDPKSDFGYNGVVSLGEFRQKIDSEGNEYAQIVREDYQGALSKLAKNQDHKGEVAREFLKVLTPNYSENISESSDSELGKEEKRRLQLAFRNFDGSLRSVPNDVIRDYGFYVESSNKHQKIKQKGYDGHVVAPLSPSDWRGGRNLANDVINMVVNNKKKQKKSA